ncbi:MAG: DNA cytosine methyltransferase [Succinivibrionaceae bacterium]|nr:DNA cytosine methyltransferase [Succinivibrionaceae bacterium]
METFRFIDLFAGIGGFHQAMSSLGGTCVFASEIDEACTEVYQKNYGMKSLVNIRDVGAGDIPQHDVLCAGFPCQAFSQAGGRAGFSDKTRGTLFFEIVRILSQHHTKYIVLENVKHLVSHDHGNTWKVISGALRELGYRTTREPLILSPHQFGIPQTRERVIILGKHDPEHVDEPLPIEFRGLLTKDCNSIYSILDQGPVDPSYNISDYERMVLEAWDEFRQGVGDDVVGDAIWVESFRFKGSMRGWADWRIKCVSRNMRIYEEHRQFIDGWLERHNQLRDFQPTHRKMEWQCGRDIKTIWDAVIQFRQSGVRVKAPTCFQALVAIIQTPIIGKLRRRLTVTEAARLQSFPVDRAGSPFCVDPSRRLAYKQLGNSVNVEVIRQAALRLLSL